MHGFIRAASRLPRRHDERSIGGARASQTRARRVAIEGSDRDLFASTLSDSFGPFRSLGTLAASVWRQAQLPVRLPRSHLP